MTASIYLVGATPAFEAFYFVVAQLLGGFAAALAGGFLVTDITGGGHHPNAPIVGFPYPGGYARAFVAEWLYTTLLSLVVMFVAISRNKVNPFYGIAIGGMVAGGAGACGGISGAAFNPAVVTSLQLAQCVYGDCTALRSLWMYWVADLLGSVTGAVIFLLAHGPAEYHAALWPGQKSAEEAVADVNKRAFEGDSNSARISSFGRIQSDGAHRAAAESPRTAGEPATAMKTAPRGTDGGHETDALIPR